MASFLRQIFRNLPRNSVNYAINNEFHPSLSPLLNSFLIRNQQLRLLSNRPTPYEVINEEEDRRKNQEIINKVNTQIATKKQGRLFAIVHIQGKQFKITEGDVIVIEGYWPPDAGDKISLDKVLMVGGTEFTLIGRPLVQTDLVKIEATVIEKSLSHTKTHFRKKRRKQYLRINFFRIPQTMLRINRIAIVGEVNNPPEVSDLKTRSF